MTTQPAQTVVAEPRWALGLVWLGFPLVGAVGGWLLLWLAGHAGEPWIPLPRSFRRLDELPEPYTTVAAVVIGALAGLALAETAARESLAVTVSAGEVVLTRGGSSQRIPRASVDGVFLDGKQLVLLGGDGGELAREASDLSGDRLAEAFRAHGYPWRAGDPYAEAFRRWVDGLPDLPPGADALLKARARALRKGDKKDAAELRNELARLGIVVRDEKKRQYWRPVTP